MKLTNKHIQLYEMVAERGVGRCCNDLEREEEALLSKAEWKEFSKAYHDWNGDPEEFEERTDHVFMDFQVIHFVQHLLIKNYRETNGLQSQS